MRLDIHTYVLTRYTQIQKFTQSHQIHKSCHKSLHIIDHFSSKHDSPLSFTTIVHTPKTRHINIPDFVFSICIPHTSLSLACQTKYALHPTATIRHINHFVKMTTFTNTLALTPITTSSSFESCISHSHRQNAIRKTHAPTNVHICMSNTANLLIQFCLTCSQY